MFELLSIFFSENNSNRIDSITFQGNKLKKKPLWISSPDIKYILQTFETKPESATMEAGKTKKNYLSVCIAKIVGKGEKNKRSANMRSGIAKVKHLILFEDSRLVVILIHFQVKHSVKSDLPVKIRSGVFL